jgi:hypothetical protein
MEKSTGKPEDAVADTVYVPPGIGEGGGVDVKVIV